LIARLTYRPAQAFGLDAGRLAKGQAADVVVIDPERVWTATPEALASKSKNSPFLGWELKGRVCATLVGGRLVHQLNGDT